MLKHRLVMKMHKPGSPAPRSTCYPPLPPPGGAPAGLAETGSAVFNVFCATTPGRAGPNGMSQVYPLLGRRPGDQGLLEVATWIRPAVN